MLTVGFLASCGANTSQSITSQSVTANTSSSTTAVAAPTTTQPPPGGERFGCATYCQNAGGYGGVNNPNPPPPAVTLVSTGTVTADADGYVPVTVTCNLPVQCSGAIVLDIPETLNSPDVCGGGNYHWAGCSDLLVNANSTRTIGVPLTAAAIAYLRSNGPTTLGLYIDTGHSSWATPTGLDTASRTG